jgi:hypothetical protein
MSNTGLFPAFLCALVVFIPIAIIGIYGTKARIRYVSFTNELRRNGKYAEWAKENRILLSLEHFSLYAFMASFFGFIIAGILKVEDIARFLFVCSIIVLMIAVISSFILYRKVPKE